MAWAGGSRLAGDLCCKLLSLLRDLVEDDGFDAEAAALYGFERQERVVDAANTIGNDKQQRVSEFNGEIEHRPVGCNGERTPPADSTTNSSHRPSQ